MKGVIEQPTYIVQDQRTGFYVAVWHGRMTWTMKSKKAHRYSSKRARKIAARRPGCAAVPTIKP